MWRCLLVYSCLLDPDILFLNPSESLIILTVASLLQSVEASMGVEAWLGAETSRGEGELADDIAICEQ
jgi:hypothetical protein